MASPASPLIRLKRAVGRKANAGIRWIGRTLDRAVDRHRGLDTTGRIHIRELGVANPDLDHMNGYDPSSGSLFRAAMKTLKLDYSRFTFVDIGSGKGKIVLLAAKYPFAAIVGIEIAETLDAIARKNLSVFEAKSKGRHPPIDLVCGDATAYPLPQTPLVAYIYNSFDDSLLAPLLGNLRAVAEEGHEVHLIYCNAIYADLVERSRIFTESNLILSSCFVARTRYIPDVIVYSRRSVPLAGSVS